jgi:hypothetical protein
MSVSLSGGELCGKDLHVRQYLKKFSKIQQHIHINEKELSVTAEKVASVAVSSCQYCCQLFC